MGELNVIAVRLAVCSYSTDCQGRVACTVVTERLQFQSKRQSEFFLLTFACEQSPNLSAGALLLHKRLYIIAVTRFVTDPPVCKHVRMWELTSHDVC